MFNKYFGELNFFKTFLALISYLIISTFGVYLVFFFYDKLSQEFGTNRDIILEFLLFLSIQRVLYLSSNKWIRTYKLDNVLLYNILCSLAGIFLLYVYTFLEMSYYHEVHGNVFNVQNTILFKAESMNYSFTSDFIYRNFFKTITFSYVFNYIYLALYLFLFLQPKGHKNIDDLFIENNLFITMKCYVSENRIKNLDMNILSDCKEIQYVDRYEYIDKKVYIIITINNKYYKIKRAKKLFGKFEYSNRYVFFNII